ncbi:MAG: protein-glutamate O-methyltransferase CheR [Sulfurimonas sp.]|jgi:chemotaxis protein methyltransferase CheR|nr:protein-glutamate O-methyltransferase CheR [Sulfurimonas sp.]
MFSFFKKKKVEEVSQERSYEEPTDYSNISKVAAYFKNETGVTFDKQESVLQNKVMTFCKQRNISSFSKLLKLVDSEPLTKQELIDYLTTNETFFYREFQQVEELVALVKNRPSFIEILCAPSATGEEPYSIAIALLEAGVPSSKFKILGIDINAGALEKAQKALYRARNVRNLSENIIHTYFDKEGELYALNNRVKSLVSFNLANIFDASFTSIGKFDFIFSRNMLIYFDKETKLKAKEILETMRKDPSQNIFFGHADLF